MSNFENDDSKAYLKMILKQIALLTAGNKNSGRESVKVIANIVIYSKEFNNILENKVLPSAQNPDPNQMIFFSEILEDDTIKRLYNSSNQLNEEYEKFKKMYKQVDIDYAIPYAFIDEVTSVFRGIKDGTTMGMKLGAMESTSEFLTRLGKVAYLTAKLIAKSSGMTPEEFDELMGETTVDVSNKLDKMGTPEGGGVLWEVPKTEKANKMREEGIIPKSSNVANQENKENNALFDADKVTDSAKEGLNSVKKDVEKGVNVVKDTLKETKKLDKKLDDKIEEVKNNETVKKGIKTITEGSSEIINKTKSLIKTNFGE